MQKQSSFNQGEDASEFIKKLSAMIKEHPHIINFSDDGKQVLIYNDQDFIEKLLPSYFRHKQWKSFIRQMNMYQFRKLSRGVKTFIFVNSYFQRGNEQNYHLIKRKCDPKTDDQFQQIMNQANENIEKQYGLTSVSIFMSKIMQIKINVEDNINFIKSTTDKINKQRKSNDIKHIMAGIRQSIQLIEQSSSKFTKTIQHYSERAALESPRSLQSFNKKSGNNLVIPILKPVDNKLNQEENQANIGQRNAGQNSFEITPGGSFSSFNNLLN